MKSQTKALGELLDIVRHFQTAMVVTEGPDGSPRARPMSIAATDPNGTMWFTTAVDSGKANEMLAHPRVAVVMQSATRFVSLSGEAKLIASREKARELWQDAWLPWFPEGPEDPTLALVCFLPTEGEFWDISGARGLHYVLSALIHVAKGQRMDDIPGDHHQKLAFS